MGSYVTARIPFIDFGSKSEIVTMYHLQFSPSFHQKVMEIHEENITEKTTGAYQDKQNKRGNTAQMY